VVDKILRFFFLKIMSLNLLTIQYTCLHRVSLSLFIIIYHIFITVVDVHASKSDDDDPLANPQISQHEEEDFNVEYIPSPKYINTFYHPKTI